MLNTKTLKSLIASRKVENFDAQQVRRAQNLQGKARDMALLLMDKHSKFVAPPLFFSFLGKYESEEVEQLSQWLFHEGDSAPLVEAFLQFFPENWREQVRRGWEWKHNVSDRERLQYMVACTNYLLRYDLSFEEYICYENILEDSFEVRRFLTPMVLHELNSGNQSIFHLFVGILQGKGDSGDVSDFKIDLLMACDRPDAWEAVMHLLVTAQRQDGIRDAVMGCLELASPKAKIRLFRCIRDHDLLRFHSIVYKIRDYFKIYSDAKDIKEAQMILDWAIQFLETPQEIPNSIERGGTLEAFMAMSVLCQTDSGKWETLVPQILALGTYEQKSMVLGLLERNLMDPTQKYHFLRPLLDQEDPTLAFRALYLMSIEVMKTDESLFPALESLLLRLPRKAKNVTKQPFWWQNVYGANRAAVVKKMLDWSQKKDSDPRKLLPYIADMEPYERFNFFKLLFREVYDYLYFVESVEANPDIEPVPFPTHFDPSLQERELIIQCLGDQYALLSETAFKLLPFMTWHDAEVSALQRFLGQKAGGLRQSSIKALLLLPDERLTSIISELLQSEDEAMRVGGLDLLQQVKQTDRLLDVVRVHVANFANNQRISPQERLLWEGLRSEKDQHFDLRKGLGLYAPAKATIQVSLTPPQTGTFVEKMLGKPNLGLSVGFGKLVEEIKKVDDLIVSKNGELVEITDEDGQRHGVIFGEWDRIPLEAPLNGIPKTMANNLVFHEIWVAWYQESGLTALDLALLTYGLQYSSVEEPHLPMWAKQLLDTYIPSLLKNALKKSKCQYPNAITIVINALANTYPLPDLYDVALDLTAHYFCQVPEERRLESFGENHSKRTIFDLFKGWLHVMPTFYRSSWAEVPVFTQHFSDAHFTRYFNLLFWLAKVGKPHNDLGDHGAGLYFVARAHSIGLVPIDTLYALAMENPDTILCFLTDEYSPHTQAALRFFPFLATVRDHCRDRVMEIELRRGDSTTPVSHHAATLSCIHGLSYFVGLLKGLGRDELYRGYFYMYEKTFPKQAVFSNLLRRCFPAPNETVSSVAHLLLEQQIPQKRLIEAALYAPQWLDIIEQTLNWSGLKTMAWWFHAHVRDDMEAKKEAEIARFSALSTEAFKDGAVDIAWFWDAYKQVGAERFMTIHEAAKYVSKGTGHARARLYADALLGKLSEGECRKRALEKRHQDSVRALGLIPLSAQKVQEDVLSRYKFLKAFKHESRQFGAQRQVSETLAVTMALENLSRTAGYPDPIRLTWEMEAIEAQAVMKKAQTLDFNGTNVSLQVDARGKVDIVAHKGSKQLAGIPSALKKDPLLLELNELKKQLNQQHTRIQKGLEEAMLRGDAFEVAELEKLAHHPVIKPLLDSLVFMDGKHIGFYGDKTLHAPNGPALAVGEDSKLKIAHCVDLHASGTWAYFQRHLYDKQIVQPFKQVFRELYLPSADEISNPFNSKRYAGHQLQKAQAAALLKKRGWIPEDYGMQKVFHSENIVAYLVASGYWFASGYMETPTIENIEFRARKTGTDIPISAVPPRIFSEVMRDIDLIVSVANVGGVDVEASLSSIELRKMLVSETARLFRLHNVNIVDNKVLIKGNRRDYVLNLGSGTTHIMAGAALSIQTADSQQRGRLFLPFADDDPRTSEILAKLLLLANDNEIKDPSILDQLNR